MWTHFFYTLTGNVNRYAFLDSTFHSDRLWNFLEEACTELDLHLASISNGDDSREADDTFSRYSSALQQVSQLKTRLGSKKQAAVFLDQLVTYFSVTLVTASANSSFRSLQNGALKSWEAVKKTVSKI